MKFPRTVYAIRHNVTQRVYIGSSANVERRIYNHLSQLRAGKHPVEDMQSDFDRYGENYTVTHLDVIAGWNDKNKEYLWMQRMNSYIRGTGYNYKDNCRFDDESEAMKPLPKNTPTNTALLLKKIDESGYKIRHLAKELNITAYTLTKCITNRAEFSVSQIKKLCELLNITSAEEKFKIFFATIPQERS